MKQMKYLCIIPLILTALAVLWHQRSSAYIEAAMNLPSVILQSTTICVMQVTEVNKEKNLIIYKKLRDLKGKHNQEVIRHNIGNAGLRPNEWKDIINLAEVGQIAIFFHNGSASETYLVKNWYQAYPRGDWWDMSHAEPFLLRSFSGKATKLIEAVEILQQGKETIVPCMVDGNKEDLHFRRAKIQRMRVSLKLADYNPKRDFAGWGGEDIRSLSGLPGFDRLANLGKLDADGEAISIYDWNGDGKPDFCFCSPTKVTLFANQGESFSEVILPNLAVGAHSICWADYNLDGKPDLLLATIRGPKLYTNLGDNQFRDDSILIPQDYALDTTAAAWLDVDADGKPDILLANGYHGLRLFRNTMNAQEIVKLQPPQLRSWYYIGPFDNSGFQGFDRVYPPEKEIDLKKSYPGIGPEKAIWKQGNFPDGAIHNLSLFRKNQDTVVYLYREIESTHSIKLPISLGSDDSLSVWLNEQRLLHLNVQRSCAANQNELVLPLKPGKNRLLLKICQGSGDWQFIFAAGKPEIPSGNPFQDITAEYGLMNIPLTARGGALAIADVNNDGRPDFLFCCDNGMLFVNQGNRFQYVQDSGIRYASGKTGPIFADVNNDGYIDLLVPANNRCKLFLNSGKGELANRFKEYHDPKSDLEREYPGLTSVVAGDINNDGKIDLILTSNTRVNRYLEGRGNGLFVDNSSALGLDLRHFHSNCAALADLNLDGHLDLLLFNKKEESCILFRRGAPNESLVPFSLILPDGWQQPCFMLELVDKDNKIAQKLACNSLQGRGGQNQLVHLALLPGDYQVKWSVFNSKDLKREEKSIHVSKDIQKIDLRLPASKLPASKLSNQK